VVTHSQEEAGARALPLTRPWPVGSSTQPLPCRSHYQDVGRTLSQCDAPVPVNPAGGMLIWMSRPGEALVSGLSGGAHHVGYGCPVAWCCRLGGARGGLLRLSQCVDEQGCRRQFLTVGVVRSRGPLPRLGFLVSSQSRRSSRRSPRSSRRSARRWWPCATTAAPPTTAAVLRLR
jgi:hypothetical protein